MSKHIRKLPSDPIQAAHSILAQLTGEEPRMVPGGKEPATVALGRKGGLKGGKARAEALASQQRKLSALKAAYARWSKKTTT
ncbi:MAG TPA: hypothetical protein VNU22_03525 [Candidatus Acidoferrum sp.]|jgi:hypothetical protein|nr:hypothetical protein [Candidatus Acidoferrum sp.]